MKQKLKGVLWGLVLLIIGVAFALNVLDIELPFKIFFDGWWTLFIIIPCAIALVTEKDKFGSFIGILIGVGLLLAANDVITYGDFGKLIIPTLLILLGIYVIFRTFVKKQQTNGAANAVPPSSTSQTNGKKGTSYSAFFAGEDVHFQNEVFTGTNLTAIFGGVECDLRGALIEQDVSIEATTVFGGIDIFLPPNVRLVVDSTSIFGGVDNTYLPSNDLSVPTVTIHATCIFGGIDVK